MMNNSVHSIVIAFLVAELFEILIYANQRTCDVTRWTQNDVKSQNICAHINPIHKWPLFYFCSVIVQISLPSLTLEQEFFSI